jgi:dihydroorotase
MDEFDYDLIIRAARMLCPASGFCGPGAVAVRGERIAACGANVPGSARETLHFPHGVLLPGLVDLHAHPARGGSKYGVDPDVHLLPRGTTTVLSQGDAGAANWPHYREAVIKACRTRVRLAINLAAPGESKPGACLADLEDADAGACVRAVEEGGDAIWGIAVNTSVPSCGTSDPREVLRRALEAAERTGKPLLVGTRRHDDWPLARQLPLLRAGDVVTYCFHGQPEGVVQGGRVIDAAWAARERCVLFDVGHGMASFQFDVAERAIAEGFLPDTISTDYYQRHVGSVPPHDLPRTLSKLIAAGMSEADAFARVTSRPAEVLGLSGEVGALRAGACADLVVLRQNDEAAPLSDCRGQVRDGACWEAVLTLRAGELVCAPSVS